MSKRDDDCPLCRGDYSDEFVEMILSAKPMEKRMTADEFVAWLSRIGDAEA